MSRASLAILAISGWAAISPALAQDNASSLSFAARRAQAIPRTIESNQPPAVPERPKTCTYQGGPKSGNWACR
jgi:hypothetical protein